MMMETTSPILKSKYKLIVNDKTQNYNTSVEYIINKTEKDNKISKLIHLGFV